jgi:hypothetical protein
MLKDILVGVERERERERERKERLKVSKIALYNIFSE